MEQLSFNFIDDEGNVGCGEFIVTYSLEGSDKQYGLYVQFNDDNTVLLNQEGKTEIRACSFIKTEQDYKISPLETEEEMDQATIVLEDIMKELKGE